MLELISLLFSTLARLSRKRRDLVSRTCSCGTNSTSRSVPVLALTSRPETGFSGWWSGA